MQRLALGLITAYAATVGAVGIYVYWATVVTPSDGLAGVWLMAVSLPTSAVLLVIDVPGTGLASIVTLVLVGLFQAAGCTLLVKGRAPGRNARSQSRSTQGHRPSSRS